MNLSTLPHTCVCNSVSLCLSNRWQTRPVSSVWQRASSPSCRQISPQLSAPSTGQYEATNITKLLFLIFGKRHFSQSHCVSCRTSEKLQTAGQRSSTADHCDRCLLCMCVLDTVVGECCMEQTSLLMLQEVLETFNNWCPRLDHSFCCCFVFCFCLFVFTPHSPMSNELEQINAFLMPHSWVCPPPHCSFRECFSLPSHTDLRAALSDSRSCQY